MKEERGRWRRARERLGLSGEERVKGRGEQGKEKGRNSEG